MENGVFTAKQRVTATDNVDAKTGIYQQYAEFGEKDLWRVTGRIVSEEKVCYNCGGKVHNPGGLAVSGESGQIGKGAEDSNVAENGP